MSTTAFVWNPPSAESTYGAARKGDVVHLDDRQVASVREHWTHCDPLLPVVAAPAANPPAPAPAGPGPSSATGAAEASPASPAAPVAVSPDVVINVNVTDRPLMTERDVGEVVRRALAATEGMRGLPALPSPQPFVFDPLPPDAAPVSEAASRPDEAAAPPAPVVPEALQPEPIVADSPKAQPPKAKRKTRRR